MRRNGLAFPGPYGRAHDGFGEGMRDRAKNY